MSITDHRKGPRRRGDELTQAVFEATMAELLEHGYARLTVERVAERSRTSKASIYRRWAGRTELVLDTLINLFPGIEDLPDTGDLREDLLTVLRSMAAVMAGRLGQVSRAVMTETMTDPELAQRARQRFVERRHDLFLTLLRRWADRGEVREQALNPRVASVGPCLLRDHFLLAGPPIPDQGIIEIVDDVLLPLVRINR